MIGVDEVGRGSWAGPLLVVAARQIGSEVEGLRDSKLMTRSQRGSVYHLLTANYQFGEGWVSPAEIDGRGLAKALGTGVKRALDHLGAKENEEVILDGRANYLPARFKNSRCLVNADASVPLVSAASIYAKVARDNYMNEMARAHPAYGFESNAGYGTAKHLRALQSHGIIQSIHRLSFAPVARLEKATA